jgi:hypothetical protein
MPSTELVKAVPMPQEPLVATTPQPITSAEFFQEPKLVLERAEKVAKALKKFLDRKDAKDQVNFNGRRYPKAEDWQLVGAFFGHTARVRSTIELHDEDGQVSGYVASADVINPSGQIVSAAEAACMRDEPNWSRKPDFQLRSMAQTRACAKSLRNVFAFVMVLAGLAPTPAEEMTEDNSSTGIVETPRRKSAISANGELISAGQQKYLENLAKECGRSENEITKILGAHGFECAAEITQKAFPAIRQGIAGR